VALEMMNLGFGNALSLNRIVCIIKAGSNPVRRLIDVAEKEGRLIDATSGRRTRSVVVTDSNHIVLSHLNPETLSGKAKAGDAEASPATEE